MVGLLVGTCDGNADRRTNLQPLGLDIERPAQALQDARREGDGGLVALHPPLQNRELVASHARDQIELTRSMPDSLTHQGQNLVANDMAMRVIDGLEPIQVQVVNRQFRASLRAQRSNGGVSQRRGKLLEQRVAVQQRCQSIMACEMTYPLLVSPALADVRVGPQHSSTDDRRAVHFNHAPVRPFAVVDVGFIEQTTTLDEVLDVVGRSRELVLLPLVGQHFVEAGSRAHESSGQSEEVKRSTVADFDHAICVDHHHALLHVLQGRFEQGSLLAQQRLALPRAPFGFSQVSLLTLEHGDVRMYAVALSMLGLLLDDADPAVLRQGKFERCADESQVLLQGGQSLLEPCSLSAVMAGPGQPVDLLETGPQGRSPTGQSILSNERLVDPDEDAMTIRYRHTIGDEVEQVFASGQLGRGQGFRQTAIRRFIAPEADPADARQRQGGNSDRSAAMHKGVGLQLGAVPRHSFADVPFNQVLLVGTQPPAVEAPEVVGVGLPDMHGVGMLGKQQQKRSVPCQHAVVQIKMARARGQTIEGREDGFQDRQHQRSVRQQGIEVTRLPQPESRLSLDLWA
jgi:hypothetical protein